MTPDIIDMIEQRRRELGWTQRELARRSGLHASHISTYLARRKSPSLRTIQPVLECLGVTGLLCEDFSKVFDESGPTY